MKRTIPRTPQKKEEKTYKRKITSLDLLREVQAFDPKVANSEKQDLFFNYLVRYAEDVSREWAPARDDKSDNSDAELVHMTIDLSLMYTEVKIYNFKIFSPDLEAWLATRRPDRWCKGEKADKDRADFAIASRVLDAFQQCEDNVFYLSNHAERVAERKKVKSLLELKERAEKAEERVRSLEAATKKDDKHARELVEARASFEKADREYSAAVKKIKEAAGAGRKVFYQKLKPLLLNIVHNPKESRVTRLRAINFLTTNAYVLTDKFAETLFDNITQDLLPNDFWLSAEGLFVSLRSVRLDDPVSVAYFVDQVCAFSLCVTKFIDEHQGRSGSDREWDKVNFFRLIKLWFYSNTVKFEDLSRISEIEKTFDTPSNIGGLQGCLFTRVLAMTGVREVQEVLISIGQELKKKKLEAMNGEVLNRLVLEGSFSSYLSDDFLTQVSRSKDDMPSGVRAGFEAIDAVIQDLTEMCLAGLHSDKYVGLENRKFAIRFLSVPFIFNALLPKDQTYVVSVLTTKLKLMMQEIVAAELLALMGATEKGLGQVTIGDIARLSPDPMESSSYGLLVTTIMRIYNPEYKGTPQPPEDLENRTLAGLLKMIDEHAVFNFDTLFKVLSGLLKAEKEVTLYNIVSRILAENPELQRISFYDNNLFQKEKWVGRLEEFFKLKSIVADALGICKKFLKVYPMERVTDFPQLLGEMHQLQSAFIGCNQKLERISGRFLELGSIHTENILPLIDLLKQYRAAVSKKNTASIGEFDAAIARLEKKELFIQSHYQAFVDLNAEKISERKFMEEILTTKNSTSISDLMQKGPTSYRTGGRLFSGGKTVLTKPAELLRKCSTKVKPVVKPVQQNVSRKVDPPSQNKDSVSDLLDKLDMTVFTSSYTPRVWSPLPTSPSPAAPPTEVRQLVSYDRDHNTAEAVDEALNQLDMSFFK